MSNIRTTLDAILSELQSSRAGNADLWTVEEVAAYLRMSKSSAQRRVVTIDGFPRPVQIPTTEDGGRKLWYSAEVKAWVKRYKVQRK